MAIPSNIEEREHGAFRDTNDPQNKLTKVAVEIENSEPIKVEIGNRGTSKHLYNEINSVPVASNTLLNSYTVPIGKIFDLSKINYGGDNIAKFTLKLNNNTLDCKRTWWTRFDGEFNLIELLMLSGDKIELFVENKGSVSTTFNSLIIGGEYDA